MHHPNHGTPAFGRRQPELPAFCRTRNHPPIPVALRLLRRLEWLLWLLLLAQFTSVLLLTSLLLSPARLNSQPLPSTALVREQRLP